MNDNKLEKTKDRKNEKGAAMVMVLMISFLLLVASAGILLEVSVNTANVTDATAEQQAYNAAESGLQSAIDALRGNRIPSPLLNTSKPATDPSNKIDFKKAIVTSLSNAPGDTSTVSRLSRWLTYNYNPNGATDINSRVVLGQPNTYTPLTGNAFNLTVTDPDNVSTFLSFTETARINGETITATKPYSIPNVASANRVDITFVPNTVTDLSVSGGAVTTNFGKLVYTVVGSGASIPSDGVRFEVNFRMTKPYSAVRSIRGTIESWNIAAGVIGNIKMFYDSQDYALMGSQISLSPLNGQQVGQFINNDSSNPPRVGYLITSLLSPVTVNGSVTAAEPTRLVLRSTGFGPRGATKQLEAVIQKNFFNGLTAPATLTLVGRTAGFVFNPGSSNVTAYSGDDIVTTMLIPPIGTTTAENLSTVTDSVNGQPPHPYNGTVIGKPSDVITEIPYWLETPAQLDVVIQDLKSTAARSGRYFASGTPVTGGFGDNATSKGITFVDGSVEFTGYGGGILVVTGKLTLKGNFNFSGLIIVTGTGGIARSGGGKGVIQGNVVIAPYNQASPGTTSADFLAPVYDLSGGGSSDITYNSSAVNNGMTAVSNFVLGVAEK